jgi:hypothetical protein
VRWPVSEANPAIATGLAPERGATLKVYEWREYLSPSVIGSFERNGLRAQLRAADVELGLIINFGERRLKTALVLHRRGAGTDVLAHQQPEPAGRPVELFSRHRIQVAGALGARRDVDDEVEQVLR